MPLRRGQRLAEQEIPVAGHECDRRAARGERREDVERAAIEVFPGVLVAYPAIEQIAEDVQRAGAARLLAHEAAEAFGNRRPGGREMEIGDEERRFHARALRAVRTPPRAR